MPADGKVLSDGESLRRGQALRNSKFAFTLQDDGHLCLTYNGEFLWGTWTQDKDVQTATMQSDGNLALRNTNGDFIWGSMQSGGNMTTGTKPYLRLHDNGNLGIYSSGSDVDNRIWSSNTELIFFRAVHFINCSTTVYTYPLIKDKDGNTTLWDGKASNIWAMVPQSTPGYSQIAVDWKNAYYHTDRKHCLRDEVRGVVKLGHNVRWGDDVWVGDRRFVYDENSSITVHISNTASARTGDAHYEGCSTNSWWTVDIFPGEYNGEPCLLYHNSPWDGTVRKPDFNDIRR